MANNNPLDQLFSVLQNLRTQASNLSKDIDTHHEREETEEDLSDIFSSFGQIKSIMSKLSPADMANLQDEVKQLFKGEQSFSDYSRDVNKILMDVYKRTEEHKPTKEKIAENLPAQVQNQSVSTIFGSWGDILNNVQKVISQASNPNAKR